LFSKKKKKKRGIAHQKFLAIYTPKNSREAGRKKKKMMMRMEPKETTKSKHFKKKYFNISIFHFTRVSNDL